ncbi:hypothetical protein BDZ89DRAFT_1197993 [Hymenopellis radicata]|nr:hypothetical protein BDZ89DRAFT_1197993 [Hymenopellis radicata]
MESEYSFLLSDVYSPRPIIDRFGNIIACLLGRPDDDSYVVNCTNAFDAILEVGDEATFKKSQKCHKRGNFPAVNVGFIHGQGTLRPTYLVLGKLQPFMDRLLANKLVRRIMGFQSGILRIWVPKLYAYGKNVIKTVSDKMGLRQNFDCSIFPCVVFNFGRNVWTWLHQDLMNLAWFWCIITALGDFDVEHGGHLIMWEAKLVVEFPHGASIAIPSATFTHSNIPVREGECRTSGGLARWVDNGCRTEKEIKAEDKKAYEEMQKKKAGRWAWGMGFWSKLSDIVGTE